MYIKLSISFCLYTLFGALTNTNGCSAPYEDIFINHDSTVTVNFTYHVLKESLKKDFKKFSQNDSNINELIPVMNIPTKTSLERVPDIVTGYSTHNTIIGDTVTISTSVNIKNLLALPIIHRIIWYNSKVITQGNDKKYLSMEISSSPKNSIIFFFPPNEPQTTLDIKKIRKTLPSQEFHIRIFSDSLLPTNNNIALKNIHGGIDWSIDLIDLFTNPNSFPDSIGFEIRK